MKKIMIFGAASAIAQETAKKFATDGAQLFLVDMNIERLETVKKDIYARTKNDVEIYEFNALDFDRHNELFNTAIETLDGLDAVLIAHGTLPDQEEMQINNRNAVHEFEINCTSVISLAGVAANYFEPLKKGTIAVISSVAGDRGRKSNYLYGAAKGGVSIFLQGLRNRLASSGVNVLTIKPGMVDTPMTAHIPKGPLFAKASDVGIGIYKAMKSEKDIVYLPGYWRLIMCAITHIPEAIFKKMNL